MMDGAAASSIPLILINLSFAAVALALGFAAGAWFGGGRRGSAAPVEQPAEEASVEKHLAVERAMLASSRLRDVAAGVATDVSEHTVRVEEITAGLEAARSEGTEQQSQIVSNALERIVEANETLQARLEKAEAQIKAQADEIRAHESEARTDSLTKLANRRAFDDQLGQRFAEWQRKATPFSLIILDVDHFKKFNDTHGHQAGDEVLRGVAKALQTTVRDMDIACRYGGEEFAVVMPATIANDARGLVERLRKAIEQLRINFEGKTLSATASFGLAEIDHTGDSATLLKRADDALYEAKDAGRNCGYQHDGSACHPVVAGSAPAGRSAKGGNASAEETVVTKTLDSLPNRTRFAAELRKRISESERTGQTLSVVAIEFDSFKRIGEEYGEPVALLTFDSLAKFLSTTLREMDTLAQLDDGRLALLLPTAGIDDAEAVAQRTATALANCQVPIGAEQLSLSTTMGAAELEVNDSAASLINRAVAAMQVSRAGLVESV